MPVIENQNVNGMGIEGQQTLDKKSPAFVGFWRTGNG